jgi:hypothetical protein
VKLQEAVEYVKFFYANHSKDSSKSKRPRVKVLDFEYPGRPGQKTYGKRRDLLGWNINYFSNKRYARRAIDDIISFSKLLGANKDEQYKRMKTFYPEQMSLVRRYQRKHIKDIKRKEGLFWRKTDFNDLLKFDKESY